MGHNFVRASIYPDDLLRLRKECTKLFLDEHPEMQGMKLSTHFMLRKIIDFYLK